MNGVGALLFILISAISTPDLFEIRDLFSKSNTDEAANLKLIVLTKSATLKSNTLFYAYHAGGTMSLANHVYWPATKLSYFNEGKVALEKAVNFDYTNVEIRFIRYCVQLGAPSILGYSSNLKEDKVYILNNINSTDWSESYKQEIKSYLNKS